MAVVEEFIRGLRSIMLSSLGNIKLPIPVDRSICSAWVEELQIPESGDTVLYTSCLYQLIPYINSFAEMLAKAGPSNIGRFLNRFSPIVVKAAERLIRPPEAEVKRALGMVKSIAQLLIKSGVNFAYLRDEPYSGALLYELGFVDDFKEYFKGVIEYFKSKGVKTIITVDPHTHNILTVVAPRFFGDLGIRVVNYMELVKAFEKPKISRVVIHDSCLYSRYLGMRDTYRRLLDMASVEHVEDPYVTGQATSMCCGGPVESINPNLANMVAKTRVSTLAKLSANIVTVCPICFANLYRNKPDGVNIVDLAELLNGVNPQ